MIALVAFVVVGFAVGLAYFAALRWTLARYLGGSRTAIAWYVVRLAAVGAAFYAVVRAGGVLAVASLVGFMIARVVSVHRISAASEDG